MPNNSQKTKRIAKNTALLYVRMIVVMIVSLYTARVTLKVLGVSDYGVYNVVGGIVNFTIVITGTMVQATQRFLSFDLGKNDVSGFQRTFSMTINVFAIICAISFIILECVGPLVIANYLVIPHDRLFAAQMVFQFAVFDFILNTMAIPHSSAIIAYEKMDLYAYITIFDVILKLLVVFALYVVSFDKLIIYGFLNAIVILGRNAILLAYCRRNLEGCRFIKFWDKNFFKKLSSYVGWSLLGSANSAMMNYGQAILLNLFFGPIVNAAKAMADKIRTTVYHFVTNFYMAVTPQIIKSYAANEIDRTKNLVLGSSRYAYYLLLLLITPVVFNMRGILTAWLGAEQVTDSMVSFSIISLIFCLVQVLECPITKAVQATGNVKKYEIIVGIITLSFIPLCYMCFYLGFRAETSMILLCIIYMVAQAYRVYHVLNIISISYWYYIKTVLIPIAIVTTLSIIIAVFLPETSTKGFGGILLQVVLILSSTSLIVLVVGLKRSERRYLWKYIANNKIVEKLRR